jgi:hypothetical protein
VRCWLVVVIRNWEIFQIINFTLSKWIFYSKLMRHLKIRDLYHLMQVMKPWIDHLSLSENTIDAEHCNADFVIILNFFSCLTYFIGTIWPLACFTITCTFLVFVQTVALRRFTSIDKLTEILCPSSMRGEHRRNSTESMNPLLEGFREEALWWKGKIF